MKNSELEKIWDEAVKPSMTDLVGFWKVKCHGKKAKALNLLHDHKRIIWRQGHNEAGFIKGGYFTIDDHMIDALLLNYGNDKNPYPLTHVIDCVRKVDNDNMIGIVVYKLVFRFYFEMKRVD